MNYCLYTLISVLLRVFFFFCILCKFDHFPSFMFLEFRLSSFLQEYVRGLCDPELQKEEHYPTDMHCIFAGARGLFLDRLIRDTSAEVLVPEPGRLWLVGRAEPVVMAQSRVQQFVTLFQVRLTIKVRRSDHIISGVLSEENTYKYKINCVWTLSLICALCAGEKESAKWARISSEASVQVVCGGKRR